MKYSAIQILLSALLGMVVSQAFGQVKPVAWTFEAQMVSSDTYKVSARATMEGEWVVYSLHTPPDGPIPTQLLVQTSENLEVVGAPKEIGTLIKSNDPFFGIEVWKYKEQVAVEQLVRIRGSNDTLDGFVTFMTCDGKRCLPPTDVPFSIPLNQ